MKKQVKKMWDFLATTIASFVLLVVAIAMISGNLSVTAISWLAFLQPIIPYVGWAVLVLVLVNVGTSIWNLFLK